MVSDQTTLAWGRNLFLLHSEGLLAILILY